MNGIVARENEPEQIALLMTQDSLYRRVQWLRGSQVTAAIFLAGAGEITQLLNLSAGWIGVVAAAFAFGDLILIEPFRKKIQTAAATVQETFDCRVLKLEWAVGKIPKADLEDINVSEEDAKAKTSNLNNWYPTVIDSLPLSAGRIVCQLQNCLYDGRMRRHYLIALWCVLAILIIAIISISWWKNLPFVQTVVTLIIPATPAFLVCLRELKTQREATDRLARNRSSAEILWKEVLVEPSLPSAENASRRLQDDIFEHRSSSPVLPSVVYYFLRSKNEEKMVASATRLVEEFNKQNKAKS